ncbi:MULTISPECIES: pirin family protein [Luteimonas]|uniref:pirin family protein n=1 Tax=Luteimonas TaxID=83614 RepID=UPI000C7B9FD1|nr:MULTISPECIES: pirin family protein [Luteimonas]
MQFQRPGDQRGRTTADGRDSRHAFSFGDAFDPEWTGFGALRVCNEDRLAAGVALPPQRRANMEILTLVLDGALRHEDDVVGAQTLPAGSCHLLAAGHGADQRIANAASDAPVRVLQLWLQPARVNLAPQSMAAAMSPEADAGGWQVLASPDGSEGGLPLRLPATLRRARLAPGTDVGVDGQVDRDGWLQVLDGVVDIDGRTCRAGDAFGWRDVAGPGRIRAAGAAAADLLLLTLAR